MKKLLLILLCLPVIFSSCDDSVDKRHLLKINKDWDERTQTEKLIGCWCSLGGSQHKSRRGVKIEFKDKICFYNDGTMEEFMISNSYMNSTDLMSTGTNVNLDNNILTFDSKVGSKKYSIKIDEKTLKIPSYSSVFSKSGTFSKCQ